MKHIAAIHRDRCPNFNQKHLQLSCDGVQESRSNSVSIDVYSVNIKNCKCIYPVKLVRPLVKQNIDSKSHLREVVQDILQNGFRIRQFVGDNPKRSKAKGCKNHASWFACDYGYAKGVKIEVSDNSVAKAKIIHQQRLIQEKIEEFQNRPRSVENESAIADLKSLKKDLQNSVNALKRKSNILWPFSTFTCEHRSRSSVLEIVGKIENGDDLSIDEARGIVDRSVLLDIPDFNYIYDSPAEYMHLACLGVIKRLTLLTFNVGDKKPFRVTKRKLTSITVFNKLMLNTKVTHEFPRRARRLDLAVFKAVEFRNLAILFFPLIVKCIEPADAKEINLWLNLAYALRASIIPSVEFAPLNIDLIKECCSTFYRIFEILFGAQNCSYSLHVMMTHLMEIRTHGPLTETSAFKFESFYGEMRRAFVPGTTSPTKQILKNVLLKRALTGHYCKNDISITNYDTELESNNMIYCFVQNTYKIFKINEINGHQITCQKIGQYPAHFPQTPNIDWSNVGVFKRGGTCDNFTTINSSEICGKVLSVDKYLITCPSNVLNKK